MNRLRWFLGAVIAVELASLAVPVFRRLNSTRIPAPALPLYHDSATVRDLARLPDRFLFDSLEKWKELANAYLAYGHYAQADACLKAAQELDSKSPDVALQRGLCFERLGQLEPAREQFQKAAAGSRGLLSSRAWYHLGRLALRAEDPEAAIHAFEMAGETHWASVYQRAKLLIRDGQPESGEKLLKSLASQHPDDLHVWLLRSQALAAQGKTTEAIAANYRAQRSLSTLVFDDTELYLRPIRRQFGLVRDYAEAREGLRSGSSREAAESLAEALITDRLWANCYLNVNQDAAELALQAGRPALAQTLLDRQITDLRFPSAKYWEVLGDLALAQGMTELATDAWQRSSTISPSRGGLYAKLAKGAGKSRNGPLEAKSKRMSLFYGGLDVFRQYEIRDAGPIFGQLAAENPDWAEVWFYLGECERLRGDSGAARSAYLHCLEVNPDYERARVAMNRL